MKKLVIVYGLIAGAVVAAMMFISIPLWRSGFLLGTFGAVIGYSTMVIAFAPTIFIAIKSYRDGYRNGVISFWNGVRIGVLITLVASLIYSLSWEITYRNFMPDFMEKYSVAHFEKMERSGASAEEIASERAEWAALAEWYKNPVLRFGMTMMEIFPVGLGITLLSAGLLRKRQLLPAS